MRIALLALVALVPFLARAADYPSVDVDMELVQVSDRVYYVQGAAGAATENKGFISNAGAVVTDAGIVVYDALGSPSLAQKFRGLLREVSDQPVVKVILSHYHADHIYGLQVFQDEGAEVIAPQGAYAYLEAPNAEERLAERRVSLYPWVDDHTRLVEPDRIVSGVETLEVGGVPMRLQHLGAAHSDGDMALYLPSERVLFSGDIIFEGRVPFVGDANTRTWLTALEAMNQDGLEALIPGHGPAADHPNEAITTTRDYLAHLRAVMGAAVDNLQDFASAYEAADWSRFEDLPAFDATHRRNAYQVYLSMEQELLQ